MWRVPSVSNGGKLLTRHGSCGRPPEQRPHVQLIIRQVLQLGRRHNEVEHVAGHSRDFTAGAEFPNKALGLIARHPPRSAGNAALPTTPQPSLTPRHLKPRPPLSLPAPLA